MALVIPFNGQPYELTRASHPQHYDDLGLSLPTLQALVGGFIEHVGLPPDLRAALVEIEEGNVQLVMTQAPTAAPCYPHLILNEEGKLQGLPVNAQMTLNCHALRAIDYDDFIVGVAVLLREDEFK